MEKSKKEQKKEESKIFRKEIEFFLKRNRGPISEISIDKIALPKAQHISESAVLDLFNKKMEHYYNAEFRKEVKSLRKSIDCISLVTFKAQFDFLKNNTNAETKNKLLSRGQVIDAYEKAIQIYLQENGK